MSGTVPITVNLTEAEARALRQWCNTFSGLDPKARPIHGAFQALQRAMDDCFAADGAQRNSSRVGWP